MSSRITLDELKSYLWNSAVLLRTSIDAGAYKQYIFPLLFFKRICDVYDEETQKAIEEYGDNIVDFDEEDIHTFVGAEEFQKFFCSLNCIGILWNESSTESYRRSCSCILYIIPVNFRNVCTVYYITIIRFILC